MTRHTTTRRVVAVAAVSVGFLAGGVATAAADPSSQDAAWMVAAHESNLTEIAAGTSAQTKATSQQVKDLGAMFVQMHTQLDADLTAGAKALNVALPDSPSAEQQATLKSVDATSGDAFDSAWVTAQLAGHRTTLAATQKEISSGSDATALKLANAATPVVQQHITSLEALSGTPGSVQAGNGGQAGSSTPTPWVAGLGAAGAALLLAAAGGVARKRRQQV